MRSLATCALQHKQRHSMIVTHMPPKIGKPSVGFFALVGSSRLLTRLKSIILLAVLGFLFLVFLGFLAGLLLRAGFGFLGRVSLATGCRLDVP